MDRRKWIILAGLVVAVVAAVWGALLATGQGGDSARKPAGAANVVRLQAASEEVSCGAAPAVVRIYLDDLVPRPSPDNPAVSFGLIAFELPIQYDPSIVRLAAPNDVQLNSQLGQQDIDGDGVLRAFLPVLSIDDEAGQAMIGAASYVPSSRGVADNREEGIDPLAKGEPLLLMTLRFTPVGFGTTAIKVEPWTTGTQQPGLADPDTKRYENLVFENTTLTVRGGTCVAAPTPPPTETPRPTTTPVLTPTPFPTPVPVVGVPAHEGGRTDCPLDWYVFNEPDGHFSLCYPTDAEAIVSLPDADLGHTISIQAGRWTSMTVYWRQLSYFSSPDFTDRCALAPAWGERQEVTLAIAGNSVPACAGFDTLKPSDAPPLPSTFAEIPLGGDGGYVTLFLTEADGSAFAGDRATFAAVLASLRLGE